MIRKPLAFAAAIVLAFTSLAACSKKETGSSGSDKDFITEHLLTSDTSFNEKFGGVSSVKSGPQITLGNTTAAPGETAEITLSISNAELKWSMCGIHLTYPDVLDCVLSDEEELLVKYKKGDALEAASGIVTMLWVNKLPEVMTSRHLGSLFITAICNGDKGLDGDIATFYFVVPEDAKPGAVYNIGYYYMKSDLFINAANDPTFEKYAFEHMQGGTITVV